MSKGFIKKLKIIKRYRVCTRQHINFIQQSKYGYKRQRIKQHLKMICLHCFDSKCI